ncbi:MAG: UDP-N-acetylmuramate dehydrogenase [bacterium]
MVTIQHNKSLLDLNTFGLDVKARLFADISNVSDIQELIKLGHLENKRHMILGRGANILFSDDYSGLVLKINIKGIKHTLPDKNSVLLGLGGGEDWGELVKFAVDQRWGGVENMAMIPGTVGAAPIQNIAAYGQSLSDVFVSLEAVDLSTGELCHFSKDKCEFAYRHSIFRGSLKGKYLITKVLLKLSRDPIIDTTYHSRYESVSTELEKAGEGPYTLEDVYNAVCNIRRNKLPEVGKVGSAGSFFKNPVVSKKKLFKLQKKVPNVQFYPVDGFSYPQPDDPQLEYANYVKVAAGWLLEEIGWKGKRVGNVGTWDKHALIVVNYGGATAKEVTSFAKRLKNAFFKAYGIELEDEVAII